MWNIMGKWAVAAAMLLGLTLTATEVLAQRGGGRGGFGGRPGGAGMGMMGGGMAPDRLLMMQEVRDELEVTEEQMTQLREAMDSLRGEGPGFGRPGANWRDASEEEREKMRTEMMERAKERADKVKAKLTEILLPMQLERLEQIAVQVQGVNALNNPDVAKKLELTEQQVTEIRTTIQDAFSGLRDQMREAFESGDRGNIREKMQELRKGLEEKVVAQLTDAQREAFEKMKGEPFELPAGAAFGGPRNDRGPAADRGPGGRGGRGGRRGGNTDPPDA